MTRAQLDKAAANDPVTLPAFAAVAKELMK
jgi:hypothetical protein